MLEMHANNREEIKQARAGDIVALCGLKVKKPHRYPRHRVRTNTIFQAILPALSKISPFCLCSLFLTWKGCEYVSIATHGAFDGGRVGCAVGTIAFLSGTTKLQMKKRGIPLSIRLVMLPVKKR